LPVCPVFIIRRGNLNTLLQWHPVAQCLYEEW